MSENDAGSPGPGSLAGTVLSGRYRLQEQIGSGGMGAVWRAEDSLLNREVAVKLLHPAQMAEPTSRERFRTEGRITAGLSHPGIAQVYDYGEQDGHAYLIMELVPGEPLASILRRNDGLEPSVTLDIIGQAAAALAAAHARGVVHRDIKPGNLLVTENGTVKLTDFGIARGNESVTLTQTGMVMGTAQYISPEQASGRPATHASDIYALGVVAYECLAGQPPFTADTPLALALAHTREPPPPLPADVPPQAAALVERLLEKPPEARPSSAGDVAAAAQRLRNGMDAALGGSTTAMDLPDPAHTMVAGVSPTTSPDGITTAAGGAQGGGTGPAADRYGDDSLDRASSPRRRASLPLVLAAVAAAAVLVLGVVWAGRYFGTPEAEGNSVGNQQPNASESASEPQPSNTQEETSDGDSGVQDYPAPDDNQTDDGSEPTQAPSTEPASPPTGGDGTTDEPAEPTGDDDPPSTGDPGEGDTPPGNGGSTPDTGDDGDTGDSSGGGSETD
ncbi:serine/threonine-protein kinase [Streptomonospora wellingtoniae]|uniref:non-specific serine/threonine protein kinase n=1 Tax=Streptomonospora wellingtoniae TaxID=3075544 RepID=A0ABU2KXB1_9ACTN|nr:protein kinase [Streptomonospora sp. DSM 45055]MDT0303946.1 protein kinase [Streptomonospora sp. DSM 45055]